MQDLNYNIREYNSKYPGLVAQRLNLEFLKKITKNFSKEKILGAGGYATVYKVYLNVMKDSYLCNVSHNWHKNINDNLRT